MPNFIALGLLIGFVAVCIVGLTYALLELRGPARSSDPHRARTIGQRVMQVDANDERERINGR
jgi:xanthosine utilization system XapX-like protein